jgi:hypothetical protein
LKLVMHGKRGDGRVHKGESVGGKDTKETRSGLFSRTRIVSVG